jgi:hypothetical protein
LAFRLASPNRASLYDENRRWLSRVYTVNAAGVWLMDSQYTRDPAIGRIGKITGLTTDENWTYYYDDLDRLTYAGNAGDWTRAETTGPRRASRAFVR